MDEAAAGLLMGLAERDLHKKLNVLINEMYLIRQDMTMLRMDGTPQTQPQTTLQTVQYDWQNKDFQDACEAIRVDFYARHPEITRAPGNFAKLFPEKGKAVEILDRMGELNRIHPDELLILLREIYNF